ncbi:MAG: retropepsin-like aspartic protease [Candidatus Omnitrophica bacterium]|nr:retropepsin-like aspartic protease [Candidatus Omnitrophota bacterium]
MRLIKEGRLSKYNPVALLLFFLSVPGFMPWAAADTIYLKNGRSIEGIVKKENADDIELEISFGSMKFPQKQIDHIVRSSPREAELIRQEWVKEKIRAQERAKEAELRREYEPKEVSVDKQSGHVKVTTTLNNKAKANLILDTGASLVILSSKIANSLGIKDDANSPSAVDLIMADGRSVRARMVTLDSVKVQDSEVKDIEAAIMPEKESASIPEDGLLGMSFLKKFNFKIDQKNDKLILEKL